MPNPIGHLQSRAHEMPTIGFGRVATSLRNRFNPLNNINPKRLGDAIDSYRHGYIAALARICEELGSRDDTWAIAAEKYTASVARCAWEVKPIEGYEKDDAALKQAEALRKVYASLTATHALSGDIKGGVRRLIKQMLDARSIGWSVHEITVEYEGHEPRLTLTQAPLWWFEATKGRLRYVPQDYGLYGEPLLPNRWLIHGGAGIGVACAIAAIFKRLSVEDWLIWSERFGQPGIHATTSAVPDSPEWEQAVQAVQAYSADWQVLTGEGVKFEPIAAGNAGAIPYPKLVERMDRAIAALWRGADLSTLSAGTGEGSGASLQGEEADMIEQDACAEVSETLHATIDRLIVDLVFGRGTPLLATFSLTPATRPNIQREIAIDTHLISMGAKLSMRDALSRYGRVEIDPTDNDDRAMVAQTQGLTSHLAPSATQSPARQSVWNEAVHNSTLHAQTSALPQLAEALQADLNPAAKAVQELLSAPTPKKARDLIARLPELLPDDPEMAAILEGELAATFGDALASSESGLSRQSEATPEEKPIANSKCRAEKPEECRVHGTKPGAGQREPETKSKRDNHGTHDEEKLTANPDLNKKRLLSVFTHLTGKKDGFEDKAYYRTDTGWIGIAYGWEGNPNPDKNGRTYNGGYGLSHIFAKHPEATQEVIIDTVINGECYKHGSQRRKLYLIKGNSVAVLTKYRTGRLLITDYAKLKTHEIQYYKSAGKYHVKGDN